MSGADQALFEPLEPPPGGLTRLRARLGRERRVARLRSGAALAIGGALAAALLVALLARAHREPRVDLVAALRAREARRPEPVSLRPGQLAALERLPSGNPDVVLYRVELLAPQHY